MTDRSSLAHRPTIATERLVLRRPRDGDQSAIIAVVGQRAVALRLARIPHPYEPSDAAFFLDQVVPNEWVWAITIRGSDTLVGAVGLTPDDGSAAPELGYWLSPDHWAQGIATEAARAVVSYGFDTLHASALTSGYFADNPVSGRVLEKLGFVETGRTMRPCLAAGTTVPSVRMRLSAPRPLPKDPS